MWRHIAQSVQGLRHRVAGTPCQDNCRVLVLGEESSAALVACVADGAGSSDCSEVGSQLACESIVASAVAFFESRRSFAGLAWEDIVNWCDAARQKIDECAQSGQREIRDYATTLCAAVVSREGAVLFQIGDGAIILRRNAALGVVFWPQSGEYVNTTNFLTSKDFRDQLQIQLCEGEFSDIALLSDGLERLALKFDTFTPHPPFFEPLFTALRQTGDLAGLAGELGQLLQSDFVQTKNDDDKTLVLASRVDRPATGAD